MRIKLTDHYQSMALQIVPGEYDINDPALHGKGKYLVDTGHAVDVTPAPVVPVTSEPAAPVTEAPKANKRK